MTPNDLAFLDFYFYFHYHQHFTTSAIAIAIANTVLTLASQTGWYSSGPPMLAENRTRDGMEINSFCEFACWRGVYMDHRLCDQIESAGKG